jgi:hypothetical protein
MKSEMNAPTGLSTRLLAPEAITLRIATARGVRVLLDSDLAALYEVETKRFNEAVRRNPAKFPADFMFQLTAQEWSALRSQFAALDAAPEGRAGRGQHRKYLPYAFTEHGAIMAANLLSSPRAIEVSVYVVRAFVRMRELAAKHTDLAERLTELEEEDTDARDEPRDIQPQDARPARAGVGRTARAHDAARSAQVAHRVRSSRGQERQEDFVGKTPDLI